MIKNEFMKLDHQLSDLNNTRGTAIMGGYSRCMDEDHHIISVFVLNFFFYFDKKY